MTNRKKISSEYLDLLSADEALSLVLEKVVEERGLTAGPRHIMDCAGFKPLIENKAKPTKKMLSDHAYYAGGPKKKGRRKGSRNAPENDQDKDRWEQVLSLVRNGMLPAKAISRVADNEPPECRRLVRDRLHKRAVRNGLVKK